MGDDEIMIIRAGLVALTLLAAAGCTAAPQSAPSPSPTPTVVPTTASPSPTSTPGATVTIECYDVDKDETYVFEITDLASPQRELAKAWPHKFVYDCEATRTTGPLTALEQKALAASRFPRKDLAALYEACAENDPDDVYAEKGFTLSKEQVPELRRLADQCAPSIPTRKPSEPRYVALRRSGELERSWPHLRRWDLPRRQRDQARVVRDHREDRELLLGAPGTQWHDHRQQLPPERPQVEVNIRSTDYAFSSEGCGTWRPSSSARAAVYLRRGDRVIVTAKLSISDR